MNHGNAPRRPVLLALACLLLFAGCGKGRAEGAAQTEAPGRGEAAVQARPGGQAGGAGGGQAGPPGSGAPQGGQAGSQGGSQGGGAAPRREVRIPVRSAPVRVGELEAFRDSAGSVLPAVQSSVAAKVGGFVKSVPRQIGDWVEEGEAVVYLDDAQLKLSRLSAAAAYESAQISLEAGRQAASAAGPRLELQLRSAESALAAARKSHESQKALFGLGAVTASQLDNSAGQLAKAEADYEGAKTALELNRSSEGPELAKLRIALEQASSVLAQAELNLANAAIRAPFAGQISSLSAAPGMFLGQNGTAFILVSRERRLSFALAPSEASFLRQGMRMEFVAGGQSYPIRLSRQPSAPVGGLVPLLAEPLGAFDLPYGTVGTLRYSFILARGALVPGSALVGSQYGAYVFVIAEGRAQKRNVSVLAEYGETAALQGLEAGELLVLEPPPGLLEGSLVGRAGS